MISIRKLWLNEQSLDWYITWCFAIFVLPEGCLRAPLWQVGVRDLTTTFYHVYKVRTQHPFFSPDLIAFVVCSVLPVSVLSI